MSTSQGTDQVRAQLDPTPAPRAPFVVRLDNFEGPFDLLLSLISKHKLDVTEVSLSTVTDEFIAHVKALGQVWDLEQTSSFLLVAATLLDLKAARLLPSGEVEDAEDLALLEARDLLFARLLQYRAFKQVAGWISARLTTESTRYARPGGLEPQFAALMPQVTLVSPERLAAIVTRVLEPPQVVEVTLDHLHGAKVSVTEQAHWVMAELKRSRVRTFRDLVAGADTLTTVARFLALLELFREAVISFDQLTPLGELTIAWVGDDGSDVEITDDYDQLPDPQEA